MSQKEMNKQRIMELIDKIPNNDKLKEFVIKTDYLVAPASTIYHSAFESGLIEHSLKFYDLLKHKNEYFNLGLTEKEMVVIALFHDICKVGVYKVNLLKSGLVSNAKPYIYEDVFPIGHGEKSVFMLQNLIELTPKEAFCIRWHELNFDPAFEKAQYLLRKSKYWKELTITATADFEVSQLLEINNKGE